MHDQHAFLTTYGLLHKKLNGISPLFILEIVKASKALYGVIESSNVALHS